MLVNLFEWLGALSGLLGAFLLATHSRYSRYGWCAFFVANLALIGFAFGINRYGLLLQQCGFLATSLLGLYRAGLLPAHFLRKLSLSRDALSRRKPWRAF